MGTRFGTPHLREHLQQVDTRSAVNLKGIVLDASLFRATASASIARLSIDPRSIETTRLAHDPRDT